MRLSEYLATLPQNTFIQVGTSTGWLWFGTVAQAETELPELSMKWYQYYLLNYAEVKAKYYETKSQYLKPALSHMSKGVTNWKDFQDRNIRGHWMLSCIPNAGMHGGIGIKLTGNEHGIYWTYRDYQNDQLKEPKESMRGYVPSRDS